MSICVWILLILNCNHTGPCSVINMIKETMPHVLESSRFGKWYQMGILITVDFNLSEQKKFTILFPLSWTSNSVTWHINFIWTNCNLYCTVLYCISYWYFLTKRVLDTWLDSLYMHLLLWIIMLITNVSHSKGSTW